MDAIRRVINYLVDSSAILFLVIMVGIVFAQVIFRYFVLSSPPWTEELSRFSFIWLTFMGATALFRRKGHLAIETIVMFLPAKVGRTLTIPGHMIISALLFVQFSKGLELCQSGWLTRASTIDIPLTTIYAAVPLSACLMLFYELSWLIDFLKSGRGNR